MNNGSSIAPLVAGVLGLGGGLVLLVSLVVTFALPVLALVLVLNVRRLRQQAEILNATLHAIREDLTTRRLPSAAAPDAPAPRFEARSVRGPVGL